MDDIYISFNEQETDDIRLALVIMFEVLGGTDHLGAEFEARLDAIADRIDDIEPE